MSRKGRYAIIADDFTGAMDAGVHFMSGGTYPTLRILNDHPSVIVDNQDDGVLVIDTETRLLEPGEAYNRVRTAVSRFGTKELFPFFKKIDSTFRGNVGAEIDAMLDVLDYRAAAVISAVPLAGRIVENGICFVRGIPLHESESGTDLLSPCKSSSVQTIVDSQSGRQSIVINQEMMSKSTSESAAELSRQIRKGAEILLFDAASGNDIRRILKILNLVSYPVLPVGAAGLANALAGSGADIGKGGRNLSGEEMLGKGPGLFVSGSRMQTSKKQAERLASRSDRVLSLEIRPDEDMNRMVESAVTAARSGQHVLLYTSGGYSVSGDLSISLSSAAEMARYIAGCTGAILESSPIDTLVLSGGSTAVMVVEALGTAELQILGEVESGLPVCAMEVSRNNRHYRIVTKAGGFGQIDSYERIMEMMDRPVGKRSSYE